MKVGGDMSRCGLGNGGLNIATEADTIVNVEVGFTPCARDCPASRCRSKLSRIMKAES